MSGFVKFPSIDQDWKAAAFGHEDFHDSTFIATEKIDGANIQLCFEKGKPWRVGKRSGFVKKGKPFFNLWEVLDRHQEQIQRIAEYVEQERLRLRIFGELFGSGVLQRIDYRTEGDLRFFQMDRKDERLPWAEMEAFFEQMEMTNLLAPALARGSIDETLTLDPVFPSLFNPEEKAEGYVVCGVDNTFVNRLGTPFVCKVKNPDFADVEGSTPENPRYCPITRYANRNRIYSVESKHGEFNDPRCADQYLEWILEEMTEDYVRDHGEPPEVPASEFSHQIKILIFEHIKAKRASR